MIRVCKCGTKYPPEYNGNYCTNCKTMLTHLRCSKCGTMHPISQYYISKAGHISKRCRACEVQRRMALDRKNKQGRYERLKRYLAKIKVQEADYLSALGKRMQEIPFKPLTEEEWLAACKHFGSCAACAKGHIQVRYLYLHPKHGGRYSKHNVIPMCDVCYRKLARTDLPYKMVRRTAEVVGTCAIEDKEAARIAAYIEMQLKEAEVDE